MKPFLIEALAIFAIVITQIGCGEDPALYNSEILTYENPVSSNSKKAELDLNEGQKSDFRIVSFGGFPYGPVPIFDYYLEPVPVVVPVYPGLAVTDFIHPFYAFAGLGFGCDDDD